MCACVCWLVCPGLGFSSLQGARTRTDNPCLSWTSFYPAQAWGIFRWPGQDWEASLWGQRAERCPSWPQRIQAPHSSNSRLPLLHYEVRGLECAVREDDITQNIFLQRKRFSLLDSSYVTAMTGWPKANTGNVCYNCYSDIHYCWLNLWSFLSNISRSSFPFALTEIRVQGLCAAKTLDQGLCTPQPAISCASRWLAITPLYHMVSDLKCPPQVHMHLLWLQMWEIMPAPGVRYHCNLLHSTPALLTVW